MLSRIAENLYWMGRYVERAENTARLLGVNYIAMAEAPLVAGSTALVTEQWEPLLDLTDDEDAFRAHHRRADAAAIIEWFAIDRRNPSSVAASLAHARENGRTLRGRISTEMWEALNRTYLELCTRTAITEDELGEFCLAAREAGQLFSGLADATLVRDQGWYFLRLGALVERTDNTLRTLQLRFRLTGTTPAVAAGLEAHRSMALLKSLGAYETFRRSHHRAPSQESMADFLLLSPDLPRSVRYCSDTISNIARALARANPRQGDQFARDARWLSARMGHVGHVTQITEDESPGIDELLDDVAALSNVLTQTYFVV
ncbi:MAG TPA: alpha-E domain-containing protein [Nitriliruptoraceae bacterium]|nr:alpha-E domain-containing protein [Nitriliruptoraceae bacterium]